MARREKRRYDHVVAVVYYIWFRRRHGDEHYVGDSMSSSEGPRLQYLQRC